MSPGLAGKVAFITGVARGQGRARALALGAEGVDIIGLDRAEDMDTMGYPLASESDLADTRELIEKAGVRAFLDEADVRDRADVEKVLDAGVRALGRLDVVVANAGVSPPAHRLWKIPEIQWDDVIATNLTGMFHTLSVAVPHLLETPGTGSIIVISSGAALSNVAGITDYVASKHAVVGLAKSLANELAREQIRVNVIAPGTVDTPMVTENRTQFRMFRPDLPDPSVDDVAEACRRMSPMGLPWLAPEDIAKTVVYLAGDDSRWVTDTVLSVDQGTVNTPCIEEAIH